MRPLKPRPQTLADTERTDELPRLDPADFGTVDPATVGPDATDSWPQPGAEPPWTPARPAASEAPPATDLLAAHLDEQIRVTQAAAAQLSVQKSRNADLEETLRSQQAAVARMETALASRDARIAVLEAEVAASAERITRLEQELNEARDWIESLTASHPVIQPPATIKAPQLVCLDEPEQIHVLGRRIVTIGRTSESDLQINATHISRHHARLLVGSGSVILEDLGSMNGCYVNGRRVSRQILKHQDVVRIGKTRFRFDAPTPDKN